MLRHVEQDSEAQSQAKIKNGQQLTHQTYMCMVDILTENK
jgi:hypothetical protein